MHNLIGGNSTMSFKTNQSANKGFTIVELLIVVVVIAILAAITIVSYNGITARANTSSAESTAAMLIKKSEAYNAEPTTTGYPASLSALTSASASTSYYVDTTAATLDATPLASPGNLPTKPSEINFYKCGHSGTATAPTSTATITTTTGVRIINWNYSTSTAETTNTGQTSGNAGPTSTFPVNCWISTT
jgi:prepilin-type N-terminal cleavage/methylation domain-containing protein